MEKKKNITDYTADELEAVKCDVGEQEFTISTYRGEAALTVYISDNTMLTRFKKLMAAAPGEYKLKDIQWDKDGNPTGYFFEMPTRWLSFRSKDIKVELTEEQKRERAQRLLMNRK